jgi:hypothetical protein
LSSLHSHKLTWGSGSHQQSITGMQNHDDPNSLWLVKEPHGQTACETGTPIQCNQVIRLEHVNTRKNLHSHEYASFITDSQEVKIIFLIFRLVALEKMGKAMVMIISKFNARTQRIRNWKARLDSNSSIWLPDLIFILTSESLCLMSITVEVALSWAKEKFLFLVSLMCRAFGKLLVGLFFPKLKKKKTTEIS